MTALGAKTVQVARMNQNNGQRIGDFHNLPGNTGDFNVESEQLEDTIYGVRYASTQPGLISWNVSSNAMLRGFAGYEAIIRETGTSTALDNEEMTAISGTGNRSWQITAEHKRVINPDVEVKAFSGGTELTIESIDYLFGIVNFVSAATNPTVTGEYFPLVDIGCANSISLSQTADTRDTTCFGDECRTILPSLRNVTLELTGFYRVRDVGKKFIERVTSRKEVFIEIIPNRSSVKNDAGQIADLTNPTFRDDWKLTDTSVCRGFFKAVSNSQSGGVDGDESETITFNLSVRDKKANTQVFSIVPFGWRHGENSDIAESVKILFEAWEKEELILVNVLPDGVGKEGRSGKVVVTDVSLEQSVDGMSEISVSLEGNGCPVASVL